MMEMESVGSVVQYTPWDSRSLLHPILKEWRYGAFPNSLNSLSSRVFAAPLHPKFCIVYALHVYDKFCISCFLRHKLYATKNFPDFHSQLSLSILQKTEKNVTASLWFVAPNCLLFFLNFSVFIEISFSEKVWLPLIEKRIACFVKQLLLIIQISSGIWSRVV